MFIHPMLFAFIVLAAMGVGVLLLQRRSTFGEVSFYSVVDGPAVRGEFVLGLGFAFVLLPSFFQAFLSGGGQEAVSLHRQIIVGMLASLLLVMSAYWLSLSLGIRLVQGSKHAAWGLRRGVCVWFWAAPLVLGVNAMVVHFFPPADTHLMQQALLQMGTGWKILASLQAIVLAPLIEEWLFRGYMLPWQLQAAKSQRIQRDGIVLVCALFFATASDYPKTLILVWCSGLIIYGICYSAERGSGKVWAGIIANGLLFGMIHSLWPTQLPLILFGWILARVALRCGTFLAAFVLHALFNAISTLALWFPQP